MNELNPLDQVDPLFRGALRHEVVRRLLLAIFAGKLPTGTRLVAKKLADRLGISATPVREALVELEQIGVVRLSHNRGALVKAFGREQLREIYHVRRILESEAARCACGRVDRAELAALHAETKKLFAEANNGGVVWLRKFMAMDRELHQFVADQCGNVRLGDEIRRYDVLIRTAQEIFCTRKPSHRPPGDAHLQLLSAISAEDGDAAARAMTSHLEVAGSYAETVLFGSDGE